MADPTFDGSFADFLEPIIRGNDYGFTFAAVTPAVGAVPPYTSGNSTVTDLSEWEAFWCTGKLRTGLEASNDEGAAFQLSMANGEINLTGGGTGGLGTVTLPAAVTAGLKAGTVLYVDLKGTDGAGLERTLCTGQFLVKNPATMSG